MQVQEVQFHGDRVTSIEHEGKIYVPLKRLCENLGIADWNQQVKIKEDERFSCHDIMVTASDGKRYQMLCLPLDQVSGWLFTINANKVRREVRGKLILYQRECVAALHDYWTRGRAARPCPRPQGEPESFTQLVEQWVAKQTEPFTPDHVRRAFPCVKRTTVTKILTILNNRGTVARLRTGIYCNAARLSLALPAPPRPQEDQWFKLHLQCLEGLAIDLNQMIKDSKRIWERGL